MVTVSRPDPVVRLTAICADEPVNVHAMVDPAAVLIAALPPRYAGPASVRHVPVRADAACATRTGVPVTAARFSLPARSIARTVQVVGTPGAASTGQLVAVVPRSTTDGLVRDTDRRPPASATR